jgi:TetR/AcrR family transcriptional repressor of nem operon
MFLGKDASLPTGILEAEYGSLPDGMQDELRLFVGEVHGWLARTLRQGLDNKEFEFEGDPDDQAVVVAATVQGALQIARAFGAERYRAAVSQLRKLMVPS